MPNALISVREAVPDDVPRLVQLVRELAEYEQAVHEVEATEEHFRAALFPAEAYTARSDALVAEVYPDVEVRGPLGEHDTMLSIAKARTVLGYAPEHTWRDAV